MCFLVIDNKNKLYNDNSNSNRNSNLLFCLYYNTMTIATKSPIFYVNVNVKLKPTCSKQNTYESGEVLVSIRRFLTNSVLSSDSWFRYLLQAAVPIFLFTNYKFSRDQHKNSSITILTRQKENAYAHTTNTNR